MKTKLNTKNFTRTLLVASLITAVSLPATAKKYRDYSNAAVDYARVVDVQPVVETFQVNNPVEQCWDERVPTKSHYSNNRRYNDSYKDSYNSHTPNILGTLLGAAIGNRVGKHSGERKVATVVGAVLGATVARDIEKRNKYNRSNRNNRYDDVRYENVQRCEVRDEYTTQERVVGYDVAYKYKGNVYHANLPEHPGDKIRVKVTVNPV